MSTSHPPRPIPGSPPRGEEIAVSYPVVLPAVGPQAAAEPARIPFAVNVVGANVVGADEGAAAEDGAGGESRTRKVAVVISHGMGQQVPYETIDMIASVLERADREREGAAPDTPPARPRVRFARLGKQWLPRAEVTLKGGGVPTEAHVYEIYWAPVTEGRVSAVDVTRFLLGAGLRGIQYALKGTWDRWIFGGPRTFHMRRGALAALLLAFTVVISTLVLYAALATVATLEVVELVIPGGRLGPFAAELSARLGTGLLRSPLLLSILLPLGAAAFWAWRFAAALVSVQGEKPRNAVGAALVLGVGALVFATGLVSWSTVPAIMGAVAEAALSDAPAWLRQPGTTTPGIAAAALLAIFGIAAALCRPYARVEAGREAEPGSGKEKDGASWIVPAAVLTFALLIGGWVVASAAGIAEGMAEVLADGGSGALPNPAPDPSKVLGQPLFLVFLASAAYLCYRLRGLYIQFLGDVAVYVSSHQLNEFADLRSQIRATALDTTCAVYGARGESGKEWEYDEVLVAGHSLGSVVAYDTLNGMLNEDRVLGGVMDVGERTRALLTFGSPLDKTAFIFRTQVENARFREALSAAVQPLIEPVGAEDGPRGRRIPWLNVYSPFDPISSPLRYYDPPAKEGDAPADDPPGHLRVENRPDRRAAIFGYAHVQYWDNPEVADYLHATLTTKGARAAR